MTTEEDTYEATRARQSTWSQPDKITWLESCAYRNSPYRLLHHQKGVIGSFRVRLLEAAELKRSYWSALALGPVKHLGLSKAHGPISSFASFVLDMTEDDDSALQQQEEAQEDRKPRADVWMRDVVQSPVVPSNDNPVWPSCEFEMPLLKGKMPRDGLRIKLKVRMDEETTAAENMMPLGVPSPTDRLLGTGSLDITSLCLGETDQGVPQVGVLDVWIPLELKKKDDEQQEMVYEKGVELKAPPRQEEPFTGRVRVLVSYQPHGLDPRHNDICAMEAFARRSPRHNAVNPLLPPLLPLRVLDIRGSYLLVEYTRSSRDNHHKGTCRIHRNAIFVIERTNVVDDVVNFALLPSDALLSTPIGQRTAQVASPVLAAMGELVMPAILTARIFVGVIKTTAFAGFSGVSAATNAAISTAVDANDRRRQEASFHKSNSHIRQV